MTEKHHLVVISVLMVAAQIESQILAMLAVSILQTCGKPIRHYQTGNHGFSTSMFVYLRVYIIAMFEC